MRKKTKEQFNSIVSDIQQNKKFKKLQNELHHGISRYEHSMRVAKWTYQVGSFCNLKSLEETTKAALLHDFFVDQDLSGQSSVKKLGTHPSKALENSLQYYDLNEKQKDIIEKHMFPTTLSLPKYKETWLVSLVDKSVSLYEMARFKLSLYIGIYAIFLFEFIKIPR